MTRADFDEGIVYLAAYFPSFEPSSRTLDAWYAALIHMPTPVYRYSLRLICENESRWWNDMNLVGLVNKHRPEAESIVKRQMESMPKPKQLMEPCSPEIARENVKKIMEMIEGVGKGI